MKLKTIIILSLPVFCFVFFNSCKTNTALSRQNLDFLYDETKFELNPGYRVFHHSVDSSTLFYKISPEELNYVQKSDEEPYKANYKIRYKVFESFDSEILTDSLTKFFSDTSKHQSGLNITDSVIINIPEGRNYIMKLEMTDIEGEVSNTRLLNINKSGDGNFQYYKIYDEDQSLMFYPMISQSGNYILKYRDEISEEVDVNIYNENERPLALPPFVDEDQYMPELKADTSFRLAFKDGIAELQVEAEGLYTISQNNDTVSKVAALYYFHEGFPYIEDDYQMLLPLRYLTTGEEYEALKLYSEPSGAVDIFWTEMAGTPMRGRQVVDRFYNNIEKSNKYFTTWKEGWKTDRGMIYSVFGPPDYMAKTNGSERWVYYEKWKMPRVEFNFSRIDAPLNMTCFEMSRNEEYRNIWFQVIDNIRR